MLSSEDLPNPDIEPRSPALWVDSLPSEPPGKLKNTAVGSILPSPGNLLSPVIEPAFRPECGSLLHCRWIPYQLSYQGSPIRSKIPLKSFLVWLFPILLFPFSLKSNLVVLLPSQLPTKLLFYSKPLLKVPVIFTMLKPVVTSIYPLAYISTFDTVHHSSFLSSRIVLLKPYSINI